MQPIQHQAARHAEAFPAASFLLPIKARKPLLACYDFLRGADNLADNAAISAVCRHEALMQLSHDLSNHQTCSQTWAQPFIQLCRQEPCYRVYGQQALRAFMQDTQVQRYETYADLLRYCQLSAVPVGRIVLHACGEIETADLHAADSLCIALQLLNHWRDLQPDYIGLQRLYLPREWMHTHGAIEAELALPGMTTALRGVTTELSHAIDKHLQTAARLPASIQSRMLRIEMKWCLQSAKQWQTLLTRRTCLTDLPKPSALGMAIALMRALCK